MSKVDEIEKHFEENEPIDNVRISPCAVVRDGRKFVDFSIKMLRARTGNARFLPYYERLIKYYHETINETAKKSSRV